jgi:peptidylprolyl isomerase
MGRLSLAVGTLAIAALLLLAACGDEEEETPATQTPAGPQATASPSGPAATQEGSETPPPAYASAPPMTIDEEKTYFATIETEKGSIRIQLFPDIAPETVNNFVFLAREGFYDGLTFHRVMTGFMAQAGDPTGTGTGGPGYTIHDEFSDRPFEEGSVGMARRDLPDSAGSQFFICYKPQGTGRGCGHLTGLYTLFGEVIEGMDVAESITPRDPVTAAGPGDKIISVTIEEQ